MAAFAAIGVSRASRNLSLDSPTGIAIDKEIRRQAQRDEGIERLGYRSQASALRATAAAKRRGGSQANAMGYFNAAGTLIDAAGDASRVHAALALLEPRHAAAIRSCYFEGVTYEALAEREGVPIGTLKSWVRRPRA